MKITYPLVASKFNTLYVCGTKGLQQNHSTCILQHFNYFPSQMCLCVYIDTQIHIDIQIHVYTQIYTYTQIYMYNKKYICIYIQKSPFLSQVLH